VLDFQKENYFLNAKTHSGYISIFQNFKFEGKESLFYIYEVRIFVSNVDFSGIIVLLHMVKKDHFEKKPGESKSIHYF